MQHESHLACASDRGWCSSTPKSRSGLTVPARMHPPQAETKNGSGPTPLTSVWDSVKGVTPASALVDQKCRCSKSWPSGSS